MFLEMFHATKKKGAKNLSLWDYKNADYLEKETVQLMNGMRGGQEMAEQKNKFVPSTNSLLFSLFKHNKFLRVEKSKFYELSSLGTEMESYFSKRVSRAGTSDTDLLYMDKNEVAELVQPLEHVCSVTFSECVLSLKLQMAVVNGCEKTPAASVGCVYNKDNAKSPRVVSLDTLWVHLSRMISDIADGWFHVSSELHIHGLMKYMKAMKQPRAGLIPTRVSYRKLFMLALPLDQGIEVVGIDLSDLFAPMVGRVVRDGTPINGRKRMAPISM